MTDPLDRIEARWIKNAEIDPSRFDGPRRRLADLTLREARDVLALVAVARAAREAAKPMTPDGLAAPFMWKPANDALRAALARLEEA